MKEGKRNTHVTPPDALVKLYYQWCALPTPTHISLSLSLRSPLSLSSQCLRETKIKSDSYLQSTSTQFHSSFFIHSTAAFQYARGNTQNASLAIVQRTAHTHTHTCEEELL